MRTKRKTQKKKKLTQKSILLTSNPPHEFLRRCLARSAEKPHNQTSARTERRTRQHSESCACPKTTSKLHVVGLVQNSMNTTNNGEENKSMFRRSEVWRRQENATPQQAGGQSSTRPTRRKTKGRTRDYATGKARTYMASKHQITTCKSAYSWAPPKPKSGVTKQKISRAKYR